MKNVCEDMLKIIYSVPMCEEHSQQLIERVKDYFGMANAKSGGSGGCCSGDTRKVATSGCCKQKKGNNSGCGCK